MAAPPDRQTRNQSQKNANEGQGPEKYFADQFDDEEVLYVFHKHPIVMRKGLILGMLGPLLGILPAAFKPELGFGFFFGGLAAGCLLGLLLFAPSWISWHFSVFIMTDKRFIQITQKGLFHRSVADLGLPQIQSVNYEVSGLEETLLGFGTIKMQTYVGDLTIHKVHHPAKIQKRLLNILRQEGITTNQVVTQQPNRAHEDTQEITQET
ncbi:MAG TPA: PH domain-containing protein [Candidatus Saccharimonadales bacterium]|nr:PH domain-containing protein [Candidatus Saccharimonadales bacterium]